jgi:hypothetical protein
MSGFSPSGSKSRAWCRCGYGTTPRADEDRALRALAASHQLDTAECVLWGVTYADTDWLDFRRFLQVLKDPCPATRSSPDLPRSASASRILRSALPSRAEMAWSNNPTTSSSTSVADCASSVSRIG